MNKKRIAVAEYARSRRMSIYQVVRLINSGELEAVEAEEKGRKVRYVLVPESDIVNDSKEVSKKEAETSGSGALETDAHVSDSSYVESTMEKILQELSTIRRLLERCCDKRDTKVSG